MVYKVFDERSTGWVFKNEIKQNQQLAEEFHKPITITSKKRKAYSPFKDNIWGADLADLQLIRKCNKEIYFLLHVIDIFSKYVSVIPLKDKKGATITNAFKIFQMIQNENQTKHGQIKEVNFTIDQ